jgi:hypothetical protein
MVRWLMFFGERTVTDPIVIFAFKTERKKVLIIQVVCFLVVVILEERKDLVVCKRGSYIGSY